MTPNLIDILFKGYRRRVLGLMLLHPDEAYHVREIARLTNTVAGTLHKELRQLAEAGVLTKRQQGNQVCYQANRDCLIYEELASILRKTSGIADVLADVLTPLEKDIDLALVFGSIASGNATGGSDIDLLIVGDVSFSDVVKATYPAQVILGREISPKVYGRAEWMKAKKEDTVFVKELLEKPVVSIIGNRNEPG